MKERRVIMPGRKDYEERRLACIDRLNDAAYKGYQRNQKHNISAVMTL